MKTPKLLRLRRLAGWLRARPWGKILQVVGRLLLALLALGLIGYGAHLLEPAFGYLAPGALLWVEIIRPRGRRARPQQPPE